MPAQTVSPDLRKQDKAKVFVSYSRKDMAFADRLESALKARGFEPLIDRAEIYAFEDWWKRIEGLIARADTLVFVLSPEAVSSEVALREVSFAASLNKRFAPIVARRVDNIAVPKPLAKLNFIFFDDEARFEQSADQLAEALNTDIAWIRKHTEFGEQAWRWVSANRPNGLLLRSPVLEEAERWVALHPPGAPTPFAETVALITESRRAATRRRNILSGSLAIGLVSALALAGLSYWQRGQAIKSSGDAKIELARALMASGSPMRALSAALDGVRTIQSVSAPTAKAEALLYELLWTKDLPLLTAKIGANFFGSDEFIPDRLVTRSVLLPNGTKTDVFCVTAAKSDGNETTDVCLRWEDHQLKQVASDGVLGESEFIESTRIREIERTFNAGKLSIKIGDEPHEIEVGTTEEKDWVVAFTCLDRFALIQFERRGYFNLTTLLYDAESRSKTVISHAPRVVYNQPACHRSSSYIAIAGRGGPIFLLDTESSANALPDLGTLRTSRHGFGNINDHLSLDVPKQLALFSGVGVSNNFSDLSFETIYQPVLYSLGMSGTPGRQIARFEGHEAIMRGAVISSSGKVAATLEADRVLRIWDLDRVVTEPRYKRSVTLRGDDTCRYDANVWHEDLYEDDPKTCSLAKDDQRIDYDVISVIGSTRRLVVAKRTQGGSELLLIDAQGTVISKVSTSFIAHAFWNINGRSHILCLDKSGQLLLVSLVQLGQITAKFDKDVTWITRIPGKSGEDAFLVASDNHLVEVSIDAAARQPFRSGRALSRKWLDDFYTSAEKSGLTLNKNLSGDFFRRGSVLIYCANAENYNPVCSLVDEDRFALLGQQFCLATKITEVGLFCLSETRDSLEAYHFGRNKWITINKDNFLSSRLKNSSGQITIDVESFRQCPDRVVISYSEHHKGGGGVESPGSLVFDLAKEEPIMVVKQTGFLPDPGFCDAQGIIDYASTIDKINALPQ